VTLELTEGSTNIHQLVWIYFFRQTFFFSFFDKRRIIKVKLIKSHKYTLVNKELKDIFRGNNHFVKNHFIKNHKITLRNLWRLNLHSVFYIWRLKAQGLWTRSVRVWNKRMRGSKNLIRYEYFCYNFNLMVFPAFQRCVFWYSDPISFWNYL